MATKLRKAVRDTHIDWQWYKDFFQLIIFKYLITWFAVVPFLAKFFSGIPEKIEIQTSPLSSIIVHIALPFKWELMWLSSLSFVIAFILYHGCRPRFIARYSCFGDYKLYEHSQRWIIREAGYVVKNQKELPRFIENLNTLGYLKEQVPDGEIERIIYSKDQTELQFTYDEKGYSLAMPILDLSGR